MSERISPEPVRDFLYREAHYLDHGQYDKWLDMFTDDALYWSPLEENKNLPFEEARKMGNRHQRDKESLIKFVKSRAQSERAWAFEDLKTDRFLSNVFIEDENDGIVWCKWLLHLEQNNKQQFFAGDTKYKLDTINGNLKIQLKKIFVTNRRTKRGHLPLV